jgi:DNA polymerase I
MEKKGFHSRIISEIRDLRVDKIKPLAKNDPYWKCVSQGVKTILNATYGTYGYRRFSLYWLPMAECVTAYGRDVIERLAAKVPELGYTVLLGDTDSGFLQPKEGHVPIDDIIVWAKDNLDMDLEVDKEYSWLALPGLKKNYLGLTTDGKLIIKGMQSKKVHIPPWINHIFLDLIEYMKAEIHPDKDIPITGIRERITKGTYDLMEGKLPIDDYVFSVSVKKPPGEYKTESIHGTTGKVQKVKKPQHIRALEDEEDGEVEMGTVVHFVKTVYGPKLVQSATLDDLDIEKYIDIYKSSMNQVLDALGLDFYEMSSLPEVMEFIPKLIKVKSHIVHKKKVHVTEDKDSVRPLLTSVFNTG